MNTKNNFSIDLETLGTSYDSYILSIGVAQFDIATGEIIRTFYERTLCSNQFNIDYKTVMWWLQQSDKARTALTTGEHEELHIIDALEDLKRFLTSNAVLLPIEPIVWGNGATFDVSILEYAYNVMGVSIPWKFWNIRDMRTLVDVATTVWDFDKNHIKREGTHHNALDDAIYQAQVMAGAYYTIEHSGQMLPPFDDGVPF